MNTQTAEKIEDVAEVAVSRGEVVHIAPPRLPYHPAIEERFGIDKSGWRVLVDATYPSAKSVEAVLMALSYCASRKLDIFKRPVHIVPMWSSALGRMVETVWPSISELRTTAFRTKQYAGIESVEWGPVQEVEFVGTASKGPQKGTTRKAKLKFPEWCRVTLLRELNGKERKFIGPKVLFTEAYATWADTDVPNDMWAERPEGQLEKCAESAALRRTFPEEIGNDLTAEEMEGRRIFDPGANARDVTPREEPPAPPPAPSAAPPPEAAEEAQVVDAPATAPDSPPEPTPELKPQVAATAPKADGMPDPATDPEAFLKWLDTKCAAFTAYDTMEAWWNDKIAPRLDGLFPPDAEEANGIYRKHERRLSP